MDSISFLTMSASCQTLQVHFERLVSTASKFKRYKTSAAVGTAVVAASQRDRPMLKLALHICRSLIENETHFVTHHFEVEFLNAVGSLFGSVDNLPERRLCGHSGTAVFDRMLGTQHLKQKE
jgi:hypothetical protein